VVMDPYAKDGDSYLSMLVFSFSPVEIEDQSV
jgi:hypothetical protein